MYTFEQLFEAANPNRNPRLKLDIGDTVVVLDIIKTAGYEPQKNKNMVGKQGIVIARYPYSQSLKIGVDFGDGKEFKFNSHYLERVVQPGETAPVSRDAKKQDIMNQLAAKNPQLIQVYDQQKHQQILSNTLMYLKALKEQGAKISEYAGAMDFGNASSFIPLYVVNFPPNMVFAIKTDGLNTKTIAGVLAILGLAIAPQALTMQNIIMVQTSAQGCSFVVCTTTSGFTRTVLPLCVRLWDSPLSIVGAFRDLKNYTLRQQNPLGTLLYNTMANITSPVEKYLTLPAANALVEEAGEGVADFKKYINSYVKFVKTTVAKQALIAGQLNGVKAFGPELIVNFVSGKPQSTDQEPSIMMKDQDPVIPVEALLWIDDTNFSDRLPNAVFKIKDSEFYGYMQPQNLKDSMLYAHLTKQQMTNKQEEIFSTCTSNVFIAYDLEKMPSISDAATINYVCYGSLPGLARLIEFKKFSEMMSAIFLTDKSIAEITKSNLSDSAMSNLTNIISQYLQLKDQHGWPDCDIVCLCDTSNGTRRDADVRYFAFPSNLLTMIQQYKQFKAQTRQDIGDELADIGDVF